MENVCDETFGPEIALVVPVVMEEKPWPGMVWIVWPEPVGTVWVAKDCPETFWGALVVPVGKDWPGKVCPGMVCPVKD